MFKSNKCTQIVNFNLLCSVYFTHKRIIAEKDKAAHGLLYDANNVILDGAKVRIGNHVWLCAYVALLPEVTIGDNTVIAAGSIVAKDIPANSLTAGNLCKVFSRITEEDKKKYR